eukprot:gene11025-7661_t
MSYNPFTPYTFSMAPTPRRTRQPQQPRHRSAASPTRSSSNHHHPAHPSHDRSTTQQSGELHDDRDASSQAYYPLGTSERLAHEDLWRAAQAAHRQRHAETAHQQTCPFSPAILGSRERDKSPRGRAPVFDRLLQQGREYEERRRLAAWEREQEQRRREGDESLRRTTPETTGAAVPFAPAINLRSARQAARRVHLSGDLSVEDRLLHYGRCLESKLASKQQERVQAEEPRAATATRPSRSLRSEAEREAFFARNSLLLQKRELRRFEAAQKAQQECTFQPHISPRSAVLDESRRAAGDSSLHSTGLSSSAASSGGTKKDRSELLYEEGLASMARAAELSHAQQVGQASGDTQRFAPYTNPLSERWIEHSQHHQRLFHRSFVDRQRLYQEASEAERRRIEAEVRQEQLGPKVAQEQQLQEEAARDPAAYSAAIRAQAERLYRGDSIFGCRTGSSSTAGLGVVEEDCSFRPQLSPGSQCVVAHRKDWEPDVVKRLTSSTPTKHHHETEAAAPSTEDPHKPKAQVTAAAAENFYQRQLQGLKRREYQRRDAQRRSEMREALQCTFRPSTTAHKPATSAMGPREEPLAAQVAGAAQFLQRQADGKRLLEEKARRAQRRPAAVRSTLVKDAAGHTFTAFAPFELETEKRRRAKAEAARTAVLHAEPLSSSTEPYAEEYPYAADEASYSYGGNTGRRAGEAETAEGEDQLTPREQYCDTPRGVEEAGTTADPSSPSEVKCWISTTKKKQQTNKIKINKQLPNTLAQHQHPLMPLIHSTQANDDKLLGMAGLYQMRGLETHLSIFALSSLSNIKSTRDLSMMKDSEIRRGVHTEIVRTVPFWRCFQDLRQAYRHTPCVDSVSTRLQCREPCDVFTGVDVVWAISSVTLRVQSESVKEAEVQRKRLRSHDESSPSELDGDIEEPPRSSSSRRRRDPCSWRGVPFKEKTFTIGTMHFVHRDTAAARRARSFHIQSVHLYEEPEKLQCVAGVMVHFAQVIYGTVRLVIAARETKQTMHSLWKSLTGMVDSSSSLTEPAAPAAAPAEYFLFPPTCRVLVLGMGGNSIAVALRRTLGPSAEIDVVELEPAVERACSIAGTRMAEDTHHHVHIQDAKVFLQEKALRLASGEGVGFDLVFLDLFEPLEAQMEVSDSLIYQSFVILRHGGLLVVNDHHLPDHHRLKPLIELFGDGRVHAVNLHGWNECVAVGLKQVPDGAPPLIDADTSLKCTLFGSKALYDVAEMKMPGVLPHPAPWLRTVATFGKAPCRCRIWGS